MPTMARIASGMEIPAKMYRIWSGVDTTYRKRPSANIAVVVLKNASNIPIGNVMPNKSQRRSIQQVIHCGAGWRVQQRTTRLKTRAATTAQAN
jgi:hypothetical protein